MRYLVILLSFFSLPCYLCAQIKLSNNDTGNIYKKYSSQVGELYGKRGYLINTDTGNIYKKYSSQVGELYGNRGFSHDKVEEILRVFNSQNIASDQDFANILNRIYTDNKGIGILFFFFTNDTLTRVFFKPGKVIERKAFPISKKELLQVSIDMNHALGLYESSKARMPLERGFKKNIPEKTKGENYETVIKKATHLFLPESFDTTYKHLIIIPALNIGTFPFPLLTPYKNEELLVDNCSLTIAPGIIDLIGLRVKVLTNYKIDNRDIGMSQFTLDNPLFISNPDYPTSGNYYYPDLPGAKREINNAIQYAKDYVLLEGPNATKDSVLKYINRADVVYFATHGIADEENPMDSSFLVLSGKDPFLTAKEVMGLTGGFPEMAILSACQTGLGKSMEAGITGLARSFLLAGSNCVIMSLWSVDDEATAFLMNRFLFHLQEDNLFVPAEPLRKAMQDTRKKYPKPSQWASFSLFGIEY